MEGKKARKKPNFFDVLFIAVLVLVAGAAFVLTHGLSIFEDKPVKRSYVLEIASLEPGMEDGIHVGDTVMDNARRMEVGTVTKVETVQSQTTLFDELTGLVRQAPVSFETTVLVTVEAETTDDEKHVIIPDGGYTLKTGEGVYVTIGEVTSFSYILSVERLPTDKVPESKKDKS